MCSVTSQFSCLLLLSVGWAGRGAGLAGPGGGVEARNSGGQSGQQDQLGRGAAQAGQGGGRHAGQAGECAEVGEHGEDNTDSLAEPELEEEENSAQFRVCSSHNRTGQTDEHLFQTKL